MNNENISKAGPVDLSAASDVVTPVTPDISQGYPALPAEAPQTPAEAPNTEEAANVPEPAIEDATAVLERLKQRNAQLSRVVNAVGLDSMSDMGEQLEKGLITEDMIRTHVSAINRPPQQQQAPMTQQADDPISQAKQGVADAQEAYDKEVAENGGVSLETNNNLRRADNALNDAKLAKLTSQITAEKESKQVNESMEAVLSVARQNPEYANMDATQKNVMDRAVLSLTGALADQKAKEMNIDARSYGPQHYAHFASEAQNMLGGVAEHYRNLGRNEAKAGFVPAPQTPGQQFNVNTAPVPANNDGSPISMVNPFAKTNVTNHEQAAREFMKTVRQV